VGDSNVVVGRISGAHVACIAAGGDKGHGISGPGGWVPSSSEIEWVEVDSDSYAVGKAKWFKKKEE
jgi:hypothetical protein